MNLQNLQTYTEETTDDLIAQSLLSSPSIEFVTVRPGLHEGLIPIHVITSKPDEDTQLTKIDIRIANKILKEELDPYDLAEYYESAKKNKDYEEISFEKLITDWKIKQINNYVEETIWNGDGYDYNPHPTLPGILEQATVANGCIDGTQFAGTVSIEKIKSIIALFPNKSITIYMSEKQFNILHKELIDNDNAPTQNIESNSFTFPGTNLSRSIPNVRIFAAPGIKTDQIIAGSSKYIFYGVGLTDGQDKFLMKYDEADDVVRTYITFKIGTAVYTPYILSTK